MRLKATLSLMAIASLAACSHIPRDVPSKPGDADDILERFGASQAALTSLATSNPNLRASFDWSRAQCLVQHAYSELHENDRSGFVSAALDQADAMTKALQNKAAAPPTELINHSPRLRADLWSTASQLRNNRCAQAIAGCLEAQLVRAAHEHQSMGWRHADSYFAIAEDLAKQARDEAASCAPPAPTRPVVPSLPAAPPPPPPPTPQALPSSTVQQQTINLGADVLFKFDKAAQSDVLVEGLRQLDGAAGKLKAVNLISVKVMGYTDPEGSQSYNQSLSQRRADTVKALLVQRGVDAAKITTEGRGETDLAVQCNAQKLRSSVALNACNQQNRRVVIEFSYQR